MIYNRYDCHVLQLMNTLLSMKCIYFLKVLSLVGDSIAWLFLCTDRIEHSARCQPWINFSKRMGQPVLGSQSELVRRKRDILDPPACRSASHPHKWRLSWPGKYICTKTCINENNTRGYLGQDIEGKSPILRLNPNQPLVKNYMFQHVYYFLLILLFGYNIIYQAVLTIVQSCNKTAFSTLLKVTLKYF
jgi:hypothetical protein